jgi:hypothetical protein
LCNVRREIYYEVNDYDGDKRVLQFADARDAHPPWKALSLFRRENDDEPERDGIGENHEYHREKKRVDGTHNQADHGGRFVTGCREHTDGAEELGATFPQQQERS